MSCGLGAHRIVMLDSAHDVGVLNDPADGLREWLGFVSEDEHTFAGVAQLRGRVGHELTLAADALAGTADGGLFILGIHAPLFSMWHDELPYFLRQTQRPAASQAGPRVRGQAQRIGQCPNRSRRTSESAGRCGSPAAMTSTPVFVKRGGTQDLFDYGVSRGRSEGLLRLLAGVGSRRPADVVSPATPTATTSSPCSPTATGELEFRMDFYTANPAAYYPTRYPTGWQAQGVNGLVATSEVTYVEVDTGRPGTQPLADALCGHARQAAPGAAVRRPAVGTAPTPARGGRPTGRSCSRPAPLGPMENNQVSFSGFRLLSVKGDVIDKVHSISINRLEANGYRLPLEDAARPDSPAATATPNARAGTTHPTPRAGLPPCRSRSWGSAT